MNGLTLAEKLNAQHERARKAAAKGKRIGTRRKKVGAFHTFRDGREVCFHTQAGRREYAKRRDEMWHRDGGICCICNRPVSLNLATFEHTDGRGMNGSRRDDRTTKDGKPLNGVAHEKCNIEQGSKRGYGN
jgi:hypothetical protein